MSAFRSSGMVFLAAIASCFAPALEPTSVMAKEANSTELVIETGAGKVGAWSNPTGAGPEHLHVGSSVSNVRLGLTSERLATPQVGGFPTNRLQAQPPGPLPSLRLVTGGSVRLAASTGSVTAHRAEAQGRYIDFRPFEAGRVPFGLPIPGGRMSSGFGMRTHPISGGYRMHKGIDLAAARGTPVAATSNGIVSKAQWFGSYGLFVAIDHGAGLQTRYAHLSRLNVSAGESVRQGDIIGYVGSTGRSTGPHLHYELRISGNAINPLDY